MIDEETVESILLNLNNIDACNREQLHFKCRVIRDKLLNSLDVAGESNDNESAIEEKTTVDTNEPEKNMFIFDWLNRIALPNNQNVVDGREKHE